MKVAHIFMPRIFQIAQLLII